MVFELKERFDGLSLIQEKNSKGETIYKFRGPFQEMNDVRNNRNKNGRIYSKALWEKVLNDASFVERLKSRRMLGELDHPTDDGQIRRTSHIITDVKPNWNTGVIFGELEILNHSQGDAALLRALVEQGVQVCVSSRGYGDFLEDGRTVDPKTFRAITWDVVLDPSVSIAHLNQVAEQINEKYNLEGDSRARTGFLELYQEPDKTTDPQKRNPKTESSDDNLKDKLEESIMDQKILELMQQNKDLEVKSAKIEGNLEHMKELVTEKNTTVDTLTKKNEDLETKISELQGDGEEAADLLNKATEENETLKTENAELKKLGEEAAAIIKKLQVAVVESKEVNEENGKTIDKQNETIKEDNELGDEAAEIIEGLTTKIDEIEKKDTKKGTGGRPSGKGEGDDDDDEDDDDKKKKERDDDDDDDEDDDDKKNEDKNRKAIRSSLKESILKSHGKFVEKKKEDK